MKWLTGLGVALAVAGAAVGIGSGTASAGDDEHRWGGIYIGASAGWVGTNVGWQYHNPATGASNAPLADASSDGAILGGHVGLQHQFGRLVVGVEGAISGRVGDNESFGSTSCTNAAFDCQSRLQGPVLTLGGRLGFLPTDRLMLFVSGGAASASIETREVLAATGAVNQFGTRGRSWGGYVGGGFEYALSSNWFIGLEYQHLFLDDRQHLTLVTPNIEDRIISPDVDIVRARLTFKLGRPEEKHDSMK